MLPFISELQKLRRAFSWADFPGHTVSVNIEVVNSNQHHTLTFTIAELDEAISLLETSSRLCDL